MAQRGNYAAEAFWYTPAGDEALPSEQRSRFKFRPLDQAETAQAIDAMEVVTEEGGRRVVRYRSWQHAREVVLRTLIDAENFPAGAAVPFPVGAGVAEVARFVAMLPLPLVKELGDEVFDRATLEMRAKNS